MHATQCTLHFDKPQKKINSFLKQKLLITNCSMALSLSCSTIIVSAVGFLVVFDFFVHYLK